MTTQQDAVRDLFKFKLLYLLKRTFPPMYGLVLRFMTWFLDRTLTRDSLSSQA